MKVGGSGGVDPVVPAAGAGRWAQGECRVPATTQGPAAALGPDTGQLYSLYSLYAIHWILGWATKTLIVILSHFFKQDR